MISRTLLQLLLIASLSLPLGISATEVFLPPLDSENRSSGQDVEIIVGENKTVFEYRTNGILLAIKVVPKRGRPYYMVPADGSPHFTNLDHRQKLYPQWVLFEW